jgi:5-methylcytosine-specific restriction endonuclease McrA
MADRHRKKMFRLLLHEYDWIAHQNREVTDAEREAHAAYQREWYSRHQQVEVSRHLVWKAANAEKVSEYSQRRKDRIEATNDRTATSLAIAWLKLRTNRCAYCDGFLTRKETDHMTPVCLGGAHSLRNIVIACPRCNGRKAKLTYAQWIDRIEPEHRARVAALWVARFVEFVPAASAGISAGAMIHVDGGVWSSGLPAA